MKPLPRSWEPKYVSLLVCALTFAAVAILRQCGALQYLEFRAYDRFLNWQTPASVADSRIVLVGISEQDIHDPVLGGWPISDQELASLLVALETHQPRAIGLDIFRDMAVPIKGEGIETLSDVLITNDNIICIWRFGDVHNPEVKPPPALHGFGERIGFNDFPVDAPIDNDVRRGLLYVDDGKTAYESFALQLSLLYLRQMGIIPQADHANPAFLRLGQTTFRPLEKNDGAYVNADARGYQIMLDFKAPREFPTFSLTQAMTGAIPNDALRGKIVIVGVTAESVKDFKATPLNRDHRPVELQAQFVDQLLRAALEGQRPLDVWNEWKELAWTFAWCLAGGLVGLKVHSPFRLCFALLACVLVMVVVAWEEFRHGCWIPLVPPILSFLPAAALALLYRSHLEKTQRTILQALFQKFVSPEVVQTVWQRREEFLDNDSGRPLPRKATATVMFADLKGFTTIAEKMDPAHLMDWLNEYMEAMTEVIIRHKGMVRHYSGDAIMAVFGFPEIRTTLKEIKDDAVNAVRCALAMEHELDRLNANWHQRGLHRMSMRVGIYTGELVAGALGSAQRMEYTVLGDTVNIASRLETLDRETDDFEFEGRCCRILIGEATHSLIDKRFTAKLVTTLNLKGKRTSVTVYRVLGQASAKEGEQYEI